MARIYIPAFNLFVLDFQAVQEKQCFFLILVYFCNLSSPALDWFWSFRVDSIALRTSKISCSDVQARDDGVIWLKIINKWLNQLTLSPGKKSVGWFGVVGAVCGDRFISRPSPPFIPPPAPLPGSIGGGPPGPWLDVISIKNRNLSRPLLYVHIYIK